MNCTRILASSALALALACGTAARGDDYQGVKVTKLVTSTTTASGQKLSYLRTDRPEVTALIVEIPPGAATGWHLHRVPVYAYMLYGTITVETEDGKNRAYQEGDAILEVRDTPHNGRNEGTVPAKLVVFYAGEEGTPNVTRVVKPDPVTPGEGK